MSVTWATAGGVRLNLQTPKLPSMIKQLNELVQLLMHVAAFAVLVKKLLPPNKKGK